jgi:hypothetical protein
VVNQIELTGAVVNLAQLEDSQIKKTKRAIEDAVGPDNVVYVDSAKNPKQARVAVSNFIIGQGGKIGD